MVLFELKVRASFFDNDTKNFDTNEEELEKNCFRVQLLFKGTHDYTYYTTMGVVARILGP
jgi:hypothetical protein